MSLRESQNVFVLGAFLCAVALISAGILAGFNLLVSEPIRQADLRQEARNLALVLPPFVNAPSQEAYELDGMTFMPGRDEAGKLVGVAVKLGGRGYVDNIDLLVGLTPAGDIYSVSVARQNETPGLGREVCARKFKKSIFNFLEKNEGLPPNDFLDQFNGRHCSDKAWLWRVAKDGGEFDYKTGATITCRAITALVSRAATAYAAHREAILQAFGVNILPGEGNI